MIMPLKTLCCRTFWKRFIQMRLFFTLKWIWHSLTETVDAVSFLICHKGVLGTLLQIEKQKCRLLMKILVFPTLISCYIPHSHGMSYPVSGLVKNWTSPDYDQEQPLIVSHVCSATPPCVPLSAQCSLYSLLVGVFETQGFCLGNVLWMSFCLRYLRIAGVYKIAAASRPAVAWLSTRSCWMHVKLLNFRLFSCNFLQRYFKHFGVNAL